ncbi:MAG: hypothetical protein ABSB90_01920, partial [Thermoplasmata archaeon]
TGARRPADIQIAVQKTRKELMGAGLLDGERDRPEPAPPRNTPKPRTTGTPGGPPKAGRTPPPDVGGLSA